MGEKIRTLCSRCLSTGQIPGKGLNTIKCPVCRGTSKGRK